MTKQIILNYSHVKREFLVQFYDGDDLVKWEIHRGLADVERGIIDFYELPTSSEMK